MFLDRNTRFRPKERRLANNATFKELLNFFAHYLTFLLVEATLHASIWVARFIDNRKAKSIYLVWGHLLGIFRKDGAEAAKYLEDMRALRSLDLTVVSLGDIHVLRSVGHGVRIRRRGGRGRDNWGRVRCKKVRW